MQAVIMAGGKGTRLSEVTKNLIPKPMAKINGVPLIEHMIVNLYKNGIDDIVIVVGYMGRIIENHIGDGKRLNVLVRYVREEEPLGTAGAFFYLKDIIKSDFVLLYADVIMDIDFNRMYHYFLQKEAEAVLFVHPNAHPYDSDLVMIDSQKRIIGFDYKGKTRNYDYDNIVNAGAFILSPMVLGYITKLEKKDFEKDILAEMVRHDKAVYAYYSSEYIRDVGTPERLMKAEQDYRNGLINKRHLTEKQRCIFIDRDGTINKHIGLLRNKNEMQLIPKVSEAIRRVNASRYIIVIITNQPVIARGLCTEQELKEIHQRLQRLLGEEGAYVDDIYYCPHHPDRGYPGEVSELKIDCQCRKPKTGLIDICAQRYNIDINESWMIGDTYRDMKTGNNAGLKTILVKTGMLEENNNYEAEIDYVCQDLLEAVNIILKGEENGL